MVKYYFTIGIIICDKDFQYLDNLLINLKTNISGKYDIVVYNNCVINYDSLQNYKAPNLIVLPNTYKEPNSRQVYARKMITEKAYELGSDYIWFIDGDDSIYNLEIDKLDYYTDIIVFPYDTETHKDFCFMDNNGIIKVEKTFVMSEKIGRPLWCKFIKTSIYKQAYDLIDAYNLPPISCSEDTLISLLCLKFAKTCSMHHKSLYYHSKNRSNSESPETHINDIEQCTIGIEEVLTLMDTIFTSSEKKTFEIEKLKYGTIHWIVKRICDIQDKKELDEALASFNKKLSEKHKDEYINFGGN